MEPWSVGCDKNGILLLVYTISFAITYFLEGIIEYLCKAWRFEIAQQANQFANS